MISKQKNMNVSITQSILADNWYVGRVIEGKQRGSQLGFPTINLKLTNYLISKLVNHKQGVYLCQVKFNPSTHLSIYPSIHLFYYGLLHYGSRPTFKENKLSLEIYLLNTKPEIKKGQQIKFKLIKYLRKIKKFRTSNDLKGQIKKDVKKLFTSRPKIGLSKSPAFQIKAGL